MHTNDANKNFPLFNINRPTAAVHRAWNTDTNDQGPVSKNVEKEMIKLNCRISS